MPRGGHIKSGPIAQDAAARKLRGAKTRRHHRTKAKALGTPMGICEAPAGLRCAEAAYWAHYAPLLISSRRLMLETRDSLASYCVVLAMVADLRRELVSRKRKDLENRAANRKELRQWLSVSRLYENDLLLNPAAAVRAPKADIEPVNDPFHEFDEQTSTH